MTQDSAGAERSQKAGAGTPSEVQAWVPADLIGEEES